TYTSNTPVSSDTIASHRPSGEGRPYCVRSRTIKGRVDSGRPGVMVQISCPVFGLSWLKTRSYPLHPPNPPKIDACVNCVATAELPASADITKAFAPPRDRRSNMRLRPFGVQAGKRLFWSFVMRRSVLPRRSYTHTSIATGPSSMATAICDPSGESLGGDL